MDTVKLKVDQVTAVPFRNLNLVEGEGYVMSEQRGKIYLEPGKEYDCNVINDACIEFLDSMEEAVFSLHDLKDLVRRGVLTIKDPYNQEKHEPIPNRS